MPAIFFAGYVTNDEPSKEFGGLTDLGSMGEARAIGQLLNVREGVLCAVDRCVMAAAAGGGGGGGGGSQKEYEQQVVQAMLLQHDPMTHPQTRQAALKFCDELKSDYKKCLTVSLRLLATASGEKVRPGSSALSGRGWIDAIANNRVCT